MLRWRLLVAALIILPFLVLLYLDFNHNFGIPGIWLSPLLLMGPILGVSEVLGMLRTGGHRPLNWTAYGGSVLVLLAAAVPVFWPLSGEPYPADCPLGRLGWPMVAMALVVGLAFVGEMQRYKEPGAVIVHVALVVFAVAYVAFQFNFLLLLRTFNSNRWGMTALLSVVLVTKMSDTGAYFCGRLLGRHKMTPLLSPKKTIEGGIGGIVVACLSSYAFFVWVAPGMLGDDATDSPLWGIILYGVLVAIAGMVGDLAESLLKRDMQCKDSSTWMPGLGGVLDILDSLLVAGPVAYLCWVAGIVGPGS